MTWLLRLFGSSAGLYLGIGAAALVGSLWFGHWWQVRGLRNQIEDVQVELALEKGKNADLDRARGELQLDVTKLEAAIKDQSRQVELFQVRAREADVRARNAGLIALRKGQEDAADLRAPTTRVPPGVDAMNEWMRVFQDRFGGTP